ncbi:MAG: alpha/beta fold hydrolase [Elusimicrobia bacterium]|nr:alpha/beta fold hydrolase [Elusimicrobiota bacterium]
MSWLLFAAALAVVLFVAAVGWHGSQVVFQPPKMLPHTVWPERFGLAYETIRFPATDGVPLAGWVIGAKTPTDRTILMLHGWGDNKGDLLERTFRLAERFNLVLIDHRNHGESGGMLSTIGFLESRDAKAALDWLERSHPAWMGHLGVFGLSMGGALAIWAAAQDARLRCVAVDAPFPSFNRVVARFCKNAFHLPYYPFAWTVLRIISFRLGGDPEPFSPIYHVARISPRPMLFIAGARDRLMPLADVRELYQAAGDPKEMWVVEEASHGKTSTAAGPKYQERLMDFFGRNL